MLKKSLIAAALFSAFSSLTMACTTVVVGEGATADGSFLIARSADSSALKARHMVIHPTKKNQTNMYRTQDYKDATAFEYPLPKDSLRFTTVPNWKTQLHSAVGFNEATVSVSGTESIFARDDALKIDPNNEKASITEDDTPDVLLSHSKTAREAVKTSGKIVETIGAGEAFGVVIVDDEEVWYFETGTGHHWLAQRTPKDQYFASGNQGQLQDYDPASDNFMASKNLVEWAAQHSFYDAKKDGKFNFSKAYTSDDDRNRDCNDPRVWQIQKLLTPGLKQGVQEGRSFPVYATPEKRLTTSKRSCVTTTSRANSQATIPTPEACAATNPTVQSVSSARTNRTSCKCVRGCRAKSGCVTYLAMDIADLSVYVPVYLGLEAYPQHWAWAPTRPTASRFTGSSESSRRS